MKKEKKKELYLFLCYILLGSLVLTLFGNQKNPWFRVLLAEIPREPAVLKKGQACGTSGS
jgi:hypothetical protein